MPLASLVHDLRRMELDECGDYTLRSLIRPHLLTLQEIEDKYQQAIPQILGQNMDEDAEGLDIHIGASSSRKDVVKANSELEAEQLETAMLLYAWEHAKPPERLMTVATVGNSQEPEVDEETWRRVWLGDAERREYVGKYKF